MAEKEYIERDAAIKKQCADCGNYGFCDNDCSAVESIKRVPAADVRFVVRGKWTMNSGFPDRLICSECGAQFDCWHWESKQMHFCPNCGERMDEEGNNER